MYLADDLGIECNIYTLALYGVHIGLITNSQLGNL
jgi:hypothetical protein